MRRLALFLLATIPLGMAALPAAAQGFDGPRQYLYNAPPPPYGYGGPASRPLPRDVIIDRLEEQGFDEVGRPRLEGDVYTVEAVTASGARVRLVVDASDGSVIRRVGLGGPRLDGPDDDDFGPGRRTVGRPAPWDEMPNAPRFRDEPRLSSREDLGPPPGPEGRLAPAAPVEAAPLAPPSQLSRPADPRLAPNGAGPVERPTEPPREASRPEPPESRSAAPPAGVYGVNPGTGRGGAEAKPAAKPKPARPAAATSPAAPVPAPVASQPAAPMSDAKTTADAGPERKPVRVIQGVTPMNGGTQASPPPQNGLQGTPPQ